ncbi:MAG TPA: Fic family protein [Iamia sp.]|nr:Fic family protein [Iamia sp.]
MNPSPGWSQVGYEDRPWSHADPDLVPRRRRQQHEGPYRAAIPASLHGLDRLDLPDATLALADDATAQIARYDAELGSRLVPFAPLLLRSESAASSRIEELTASARAIALAELGDRSRRNASAVVANTRSMEAAIALADRLDEQAVIDMHETLLGVERPEWVGHWRDRQVWVGGSQYGPHGADFIPPHHDRVPEAMRDLVGFIAREDLPVLAQIAIAHAQFETIHPFPDGNGRTGRSLVHALLRAKGLARSVTVPISAGLLVDTHRYFDALTAYREGRSEEIVERVADASFAAVENGRRLVRDLEDVAAEWAERIGARQGSTAARAPAVLIAHPVLDSALLQRELEVSAPSANGAIATLVDAGILRQVGGNLRHRVWAATEVLDALDAFGERAGRRSR